MSDLNEIDELAQFIRGIDGKHNMGAGALAEKIIEWQATRRAVPAQASAPDSDVVHCYICTEPLESADHLMLCPSAPVPAQGEPEATDKPAQ